MNILGHHHDLRISALETIQDLVKIAFPGKEKEDSAGETAHAPDDHHPEPHPTPKHRATTIHPRKHPRTASKGSLFELYGIGTSNEEPISGPIQEPEDPEEFRPVAPKSPVSTPASPLIRVRGDLIRQHFLEENAQAVHDAEHHHSDDFTVPDSVIDQLENAPNGHGHANEAIEYGAPRVANDLRKRYLECRESQPDHPNRRVIHQTAAPKATDSVPTHPVSQVLHHRPASIHQPPQFDSKRFRDRYLNEE